MNRIPVEFDWAELMLIQSMILQLPPGSVAFKDVEPFGRDFAEQVLYGLAYTSQNRNEKATLWLTPHEIFLLAVAYKGLWRDISGRWAFETTQRLISKWLEATNNS